MPTPDRSQGSALQPPLPEPKTQVQSTVVQLIGFPLAEERRCLDQRLAEGLHRPDRKAVHPSRSFADATLAIAKGKEHRAEETVRRRLLDLMERLLAPLPGFARSTAKDVGKYLRTWPQTEAGDWEFAEQCVLRALDRLSEPCWQVARCLIEPGAKGYSPASLRVRRGVEQAGFLASAVLDAERLVKDLVRSDESRERRVAGLPRAVKRALQTVRRKTPRGMKEAAALAVLKQHPDWTDAQIARAAGCNRTSLYGMKTFVRMRHYRPEAQGGREGTGQGSRRVSGRGRH